MLKYKNGIIPIFSFTFLITFIVGCGWLGLDQSQEQKAKEEKEKYLIGLAFLGKGSSSSSISSSTASGAGDTTPPTIISTSPSSGATNVSLTPTVTVTFSEDIDPATITSGIYITGVQSNVQMLGQTVTLIPTSALVANQAYVLVISRSVRDRSGNYMSSDTTISFTTGAGGASAAPTVSSVLPGINSINVPINSSIIISFSKAMTPATINPATITLQQGATGISAQVTMLNTQVAVLSPSANLSPSTAYTVTVTTSVQSFDSIALAANYTWNFTTGPALTDLTPLTATISPANGATGISIYGGILVSFNKSVNSATINSSTIYLKQGATTITGTTSAAGSNGAVFVPSSPLSYNTSYTLTVTTGVTDTSGPPIALAANVTSTFTTQTDTTAPVVSFVSPGSGVNNISINSNIIISFSKAMAPLTLNTANITVLDGATPITGTVSAIGTTGASFLPSSSLSNSKTYTVNISTGVTDTNGIALTSSYSTFFTTASAVPDVTAPTVTSTTPSNGATNIPITQAILITFSKPINPATINGTNITLVQGVTSIAGTVYAAGSNGAVFQPTSSLGYNKVYTLTMTSGIKDTAATPNSLTNTTITFTTAPDSLSLSVASVSPAAASTNISPIAGIIVTFNKAVDSATLISANITLTASGSLFPMVLSITPVGTSAVLILPNSPMANFTLHTLQLTSGIKDTLGNALTSTPYSSTFTTSSESGADGGAVTTVSGPLSVTAGTTEGTALNPFLARYSQPRFLVWANYGGSEKLFITDTGNSRIRTLTISGASSGLTTSIIGLSSPRGVVVNSANTELYIANTSGQTIKKVTLPATLVAAAHSGSGVAGYVNATGIAALVNNPEGIAIDSGGNFYVTDQSNHVIRKITSAGVTTTLAGAYPTVVAGYVDATGTSARFNTPRGLTVDPSGNIYVTDTGNHVIRKITSAGVVTTIAGSATNPGYANGSGVAARFNSPSGIVYVGAAAPNIGGMLLITDTGNHAIRMLNPNNGMVTTYAGPLPSSTGGAALAGYVNSTRFNSRFSSPVGITVNPTTGVVYITDTSNYSIKMITY